MFHSWGTHSPGSALRPRAVRCEAITAYNATHSPKTSQLVQGEAREPTTHSSDPVAWITGGSACPTVLDVNLNPWHIVECDWGSPQLS